MNRWTKKLSASARWSLCVLCALLIAGCGGPQTTSTGPTPPAVGSTAEDAALMTVLDALWELNMKASPTWATYEGDRRFDDQLRDASDEATEAYVQSVEALAAKAEALDPSALSPSNQDTRRMVMMAAARERASMVCHSSWWSVNGLGGPQIAYPMLPVFHTIRDENDLATLEKRYRAVETQIDQTIVNLRRGVAEGYAPTKTNAQRALDQLEKLLAKPLAQDPMLKINAKDKNKAWDTAGLEAAVREVVRPSLTRYRDVIRDEVMPVARPDSGIAKLPTGPECYQAQMLHHIGPGFSPEALHQTGLDELRRAHEGMVAVGEELGLENASAKGVIAYMVARPEHFADSEAALISANEDAVARAKEAIPRMFGRLPEAPIEVRPLEAHRAADAPAAYYYNAPEDGSRPAIYYVNTSAPETRPLYNLEALAFHEAIPGHHLQIALAKELPAVHVWRRNAGQTAYVEGWALYAELLGGELDLYSDAVSEFGMYNYQAWRAARLVIDTGLHHMGWSREQAVEFLAENTALPESEVANEIDRYIAWPGQALAYMVGRLAIQRLRAEAEEALGEKFDLKAFHDEVHARGALPLTILKENIRAWIATQR